MEKVCIFYIGKIKYFGRVIGVYLAVKNRNSFFHISYEFILTAVVTESKVWSQLCGLHPHQVHSFCLPVDLVSFQSEKSPQTNAVINWWYIIFSLFFYQDEPEKVESEKIEIIMKGVALNYLPSALLLCSWEGEFSWKWQMQLVNGGAFNTRKIFWVYGWKKEKKWFYILIYLICYIQYTWIPKIEWI